MNSKENVVSIRDTIENQYVGVPFLYETSNSDFITFAEIVNLQELDNYERKNTHVYAVPIGGPINYIELYSEWQKDKSNASLYKMMTNPLSLMNEKTVTYEEV
ncbi:hypothetical protein [Paenibacillus amylolyticus]|uniref:hypothetical protein n=1 Tax=Paenibacillus amylolyticus TaxID=1451 RepID=UPI003396EE69